MERVVFIALLPRLLVLMVTRADAFQEGSGAQGQLPFWEAQAASRLLLPWVGSGQCTQGLVVQALELLRIGHLLGHRGGHAAVVAVAAADQATSMLHGVNTARGTNEMPTTKAIFQVSLVISRGPDVGPVDEADPHLPQPLDGGVGNVGGRVRTPLGLRHDRLVTLEVLLWHPSAGPGFLMLPFRFVGVVVEIVLRLESVCKDFYFL